MNKIDWKDILGSVRSAQADDVNGTDAAAETPSLQRQEAPSKKAVTLFYEVKGRNGKPAIILADFVGMTDEMIVALASELKKELGTGGSARGGEILVQGDCRARLRSILTKKGFTVKG